jgi:hypothetical protein
MRRHLPRLSYANANAIATLALFIALGGSAYGALRSAASDGAVTACASNSTGSIRVVAAAGDCSSGERAISWYDATQSNARFLGRERFGNGRPPSTRTAVSGQGFGCLLGNIELVPYDYAPVGTVFADGQQLQISGNRVLYNLIGTTYGGNGTSTFALPDLHDLGPGHANYVICITGGYPSHNS